jgi:hypothetical protein
MGSTTRALPRQGPQLPGLRKGSRGTGAEEREEPGKQAAGRKRERTLAEGTRQGGGTASRTPEGRKSSDKKAGTADTKATRRARG